MVTRREFLTRLGPAIAYPLLAGHHRPGHNGGPHPTVDVGMARVTAASFTIPAPPPFSGGGFSGGFDPGGFA